MVPDEDRIFFGHELPNRREHRKAVALLPSIKEKMILLISHRIKENVKCRGRVQRLGRRYGDAVSGSNGYVDS